MSNCIHTTADNNDLLEAITRLIDWSKKWQMCIANEKCLLLRIYNARWKNRYYIMNNDV